MGAFNFLPRICLHFSIITTQYFCNCEKIIEETDETKYMQGINLGLNPAMELACIRSKVQEGGVMEGGSRLHWGGSRKEFAYPEGSYFCIYLFSGKHPQVAVSTIMGAEFVNDDDMLCRSLDFLFPFCFTCATTCCLRVRQTYSRDCSETSGDKVEILSSIYSLTFPSWKTPE